MYNSKLCFRPHVHEPGLDEGNVRASEGLATIHHNVGAAHIVPGWAREEDSRVCNIEGLPEALKWDHCSFKILLRGGLGLCFVVESVHITEASCSHSTADEAWDDAGDTDSVWSPFYGKDFC